MSDPEGAMTTAPDPGEAIQRKLGLSRDELNSLFTACPVNGAVGSVVAAGLKERFGLDADEEDWATRLYERHLLTEGEYRWLREA